MGYLTGDSKRNLDNIEKYEQFDLLYKIKK